MGAHIHSNITYHGKLNVIYFITINHTSAVIKDLQGTYKVRNEIETKRNQQKRNEINETKRNQRNETKPTKSKRNQLKQNEID